MPLTALILLLAAAILHAGWNLLLKQAQHKQVFLEWALLIGTVCFAAISIPHFALPRRIWPYIVGSAILETAYFITLTWAYDIDDFSLIYPIARGTAPVFLVLWTTLFLGEPPRPAGLLGIILLVLGLIIVGSSSIWSQLARTTFSMRGMIAALSTALFISLYTTIDGAAARLIAPAPYIVLVFGLSALLFIPVILIRYGHHLLLSELRTNWLRMTLVGIAMLLTYVLVLQAYALARVSYAGAVREVSVVFAALLGWLLLRERFGIVRTLGTLFIFAGILIIAIAG
jgi:drug/metabolite transporter (DMT)-like permease